MDIKGFIDASFTDWDSKISAAIFLANCNFRCPFCHNLKFVTNPEEQETIPLEQIENQLERQRYWIDGVCITGGEPTQHADLPEMCSRLKKMGFQVKMDTNGTNPFLLEELLKRSLIDYVAMDIKAPLTQKKYSKACGVSVEKLLENVKTSIKTLLDSSIDGRQIGL